MEQDHPVAPFGLTSAIPLMDSSGINVLITAHRKACDAQGWLRTTGAQEPVLRLLRMVGVDTLISCHPTIEQALTA
ncbi:STAS domain-containing protein [Streptomyces sp. NPDC059378]|uniref:STAS domain-containing protein n=1 Tax=Streptomyces sp. NPDC059378 TaxID=3346815 RepID=UPI00369C1A49